MLFFRSVWVSVWVMRPPVPSNDFLKLYFSYVAVTVNEMHNGILDMVVIYKKDNEYHSQSEWN